ncbi:MAG: D-tyrosyl-tRNA(Tyr) deacylase [Spirochaetales bacterium]|jgi:D-tyrosyl-tRNA(Tyr) deacylase|nr:D-tyrosyl-tRNA(Tyr) deacylase [Spirochaetales bacterium]
MRAVVQIVRDCRVTVASELIGTLDKGLLVYLGVSGKDNDADIEYVSTKVVNLRIFPDENDKMNKSVKDSGEGIMVISQFTLYGDIRRGRRPSYDEAASPGVAEKLYTAFLDKLRDMGFSPAAGKFQANMDVSYINRGPVTILVDSEKKF